MGVFGMITSVVLIVMISVVAMVSMTTKSKSARAQAQGKDQDKERDKRFAALEERVRVLEKIATDRGSRLKDEIDAL